MTEAFIKLIFQASITAGIAAAAVMLIRVPLKKAPKRWSYLLWAVVFFRCLCPFSVESAVSVFNAVPEKSVIAESDTDSDEVPHTEQQADIPAEVQYTENTSNTPLPSTGMFYNPYVGYDEPRYADYSGYANFEENDQIQNISEAADTEAAVTAVNTDENIETEKAVNVHTIVLIVWLAGVAVMAVYGTLSYARLMRKIRTAVKTEDGVYETDLIPTAFSAGFFPAKVYIPCGLSETEHRLIVTHERVHLRRCDHIKKLLAFAALAVHWFNPLIWAAFTLMTKDMELSCDEAVLKICGAEEKKDYSRALLRVSMKRSGLAVIPIAFGETGIKGRVKNVLGYKKPRAVATLLAGALVISACAVLGTNAVRSDVAAEDERVLLEKGTTEFIDVNGEKIFFAHGDRDDAFKVSGTSTDSVLRYRNASGDIRSVEFSDDVNIGDFVGISMKEESAGSISGGIDIDCDISEITINDIYVKRDGHYYYAAVSLDVLADDTFPEKFRCETWRPDAANIEINGSDGRYTVNAEITVHAIENGESDYYGLVLLGFDDTPVYAAKNLNIAGHIDSRDAQTEGRVLLEKGTTEFEDGNGESIHFAYGDNVVYTGYHGDDVEYVTTPILKYKDESGTIRNLQLKSDLKGFLGVAFNADEKKSDISSLGGVDVDCNVSEITINDIYVKLNDGFYYVSLSMYVLADDTLPEKTGCFTWQQGSAEIDVKGGNGRYIVNIDIKTTWAGGGNADWVSSTRLENFGVALIGFDDIPVYASKDLKIVGHIGDDSEDTKSTEVGAEVVDSNSKGYKKPYTKVLDIDTSSFELDRSVTFNRGQDDQETPVLLWESEDGKIAVFGSYLYDGKEPRIFIEHDNVIDAFYQDWLTPRRIEPQFMYSDIDGDGEKELAAVYYVGSGTGVSVEWLVVYEQEDGHFVPYVFDDDDVQANAAVEITVDNDTKTAEYSINGETYSSSFDNEIVTGYYKDGVTAEDMGFGERIAYELDENKITFTASPGCLTVYVGPTVTAEVIYKNGKFTLTNFEFLSEQAYQEEYDKNQEEAKLSPALPLSAADIGTYGANEWQVLFSVPKGTEVLASLDGTVKSAKKDFNMGYGFCIEISHVGEMSTFYAHLDDFAVKVGDEVKKGDVIGYSGSSGDTLGDALLFEIRMNGIPENPWNYYFFDADDYQRTLDEIGKDYVSDGIQGIYYEDGTPVYEDEQETIRIGDEVFYLISTEEQLRAIAAGKYGMDKNFMQKSDIQLSDKEWMPIGSKEAPFTGSYNGNGFEITGLTMKAPDATRIGMFGYAENAEIYNITLRDYDIESAGSNAKQISVAPILPVVTGGTKCYDNHVYPIDS